MIGQLDVRIQLVCSNSMFPICSWREACVHTHYSPLCGCHDNKFNNTVTLVQVAWPHDRHMKEPVNSSRSLFGVVYWGTVHIPYSVGLEEGGFKESK